MTGRWPIKARTATASLVCATIDGTDVTVACDDAPLRSSPEAWATAFALPAARAGATLVLDGPVDRRWARGAAANVAAAASWWGGDPTLRLEARRRRRGLGRPAPGRALCFTGGVDSFFSLLGGAHRPSHLLYVVGFDVPLDDEPRVEAVEALVHDVARARGLRPVIVRTDLLAHPRFSSISWEHTHGAAIAAVAQLLAPEIGTVVIPPSYATSRLLPWGSRPDTDPRWSVPGRTAIEHGDATGRRIDRVRAIADHPLVHRHLRVCWANVAGHLNCGRCEKCVRTMVMLAAAHRLADCATFPTRDHLAEAIDGLDPLPVGLVPLWQDLLPMDLGSDVRPAVDRLLARSG